MDGRNIGASVRDRLKRRADARKENFQLVLVRYAIERLLYRIGASEHGSQFVLKGAMLFSLWAREPYRSTGDLDLLGYGDAGLERLVAVFADICRTPVPPDGMLFEPGSIVAEATRARDEYSGARLKLMAFIDSAAIRVQIDIGFGDIVTPAAVEVDFPSLVDMPAPRLRAYPPETVVAEKFQAIVALGMANTRMKDFFDIWMISQLFAFDGMVLAQAVRMTFLHRGTPFPSQTPAALTDAFALDKRRQVQWQAFLGRTAVKRQTGSLAAPVDAIAAFVMPPTRALASREPFDRTWRPGGPWS